MNANGTVIVDKETHVDLRPAPHTHAAPHARAGWGVTIIAAVLVAGLAASGTWWGLRAHSAVGSQSSEHLRLIASKLRASGALSEAARLYETALGYGHATGAERGAQAYALGLLYLEQQKYEPALRWLYEAEALGANSDQVGAKIVHALERLGRGSAAQAALAQQTSLRPAAQQPQDNPIVAVVGDTQITRNDVLRALDDLPQDMAKPYAGKKGAQEFLRKYVADELLWRKAQRLELADDADVQRRLQLAQRQLAVAKWIERDIVTKVTVTPTDIRLYYDAHADQFKNTPYDQAAPKIEQTLRLQKSQDMIQAWVQKEFTQSQVTLYEERMASAL